MKERWEIEEKYKWDLSSYFVSQEAWEALYDVMSEKMQGISIYEGKLNQKEVIFDCLNFESEISKNLELLYVYASLVVKQEQSNPKSHERLNKISSLLTEFSSLSSFVDVEISELSTEFLLELQNDGNNTNFKNYFYDIIRFKPHTLSKPEEKLLSMMDFGGGFSDNFDMFDDADLTFESALDENGLIHELNHSNYSLLMENPDRVLRKNVMKNLNGAYGKFNNFLSSNYISNIKKNNFSCKARHFESCLKASIFGEDASEKVYNTLISQVNKNLYLLHDYLNLKKNYLGYDKLALYDLYMPVEPPKTKIEYEEAIEIIKNATSVLGKEYTNLIERAKEERWIDVMPNKDKDSGAFSWGAYLAKPVVLLNYVGNTNSVFTLAHELGHCMHTYYSNHNQSYQDAGYTIFVAEVASTVNESLLLQYLLKKSKTKEEKIYYLDYFLSNVRATIFRQTMFSEFEQFAHAQYENNLPLSKEVLNQYYYSLNQKYFSKDVELIDEIAYEWSRIPHFYSSFYVYKYATGLISALAIANNLLSRGEDYAKKYLKFLSSGSTLPPIELLKIAEVDLEDEKTFDNAFEFVKEMIELWKSSV